MFAYGWYSTRSEKEFALSLPTRFVPLYRRVEDDVVVPVTYSSPDRALGILAIQQLEAQGPWTYQGKMYPYPVHHYPPYPHPLPSGGAGALSEDIDHLLQQRSWLGVDFALEVLSREEEPLPVQLAPLLALRGEMLALLDAAGAPIELHQLQEFPRWARLLLRVTPEYLEMVSILLDTPTPWEPLLSAAFHLVRDTPKELYEAHAPLVLCLDMGRRNLQQAAYLWCIQKGAPPPSGLAPASGVGERLEQIHEALFGRRKVH